VNSAFCNHSTGMQSTLPQVPDRAPNRYTGLLNEKTITRTR